MVNKPSLNVCKTRSILITTKHRKKCLETSDQTLQPSIREENVKFVCDAKLLGAQIDENLTWKNQRKSFTGKAPVQLGF